jgi:hypothetical protein
MQAGRPAQGLDYLLGYLRLKGPSNIDDPETGFSTSHSKLVAAHLDLSKVEVVELG